MFYRKQTPWKVPKKRKSKGRNHQSNLYYDHQMESVQYRVSEEVITYNRFQVLTEEDSSVTKIFPQEEINLPEEDKNLVSQTHTPEDTSFSEVNSFYDFMLNNNKSLNNNNHFLYKRNKDFCSGYFPNFITLDDDMYYHLSNSINHNFYYLRIYNGKYLKYLSNNNSKYNNQYFDNLIDAYEISNTNSDRLLESINPKIFKSNSVNPLNPQINAITNNHTQNHHNEIEVNSSNHQISQVGIFDQQDSEIGIPEFIYNTDINTPYPHVLLTNTNLR